MITNEFGEFQPFHGLNVKYIGYWNNEKNQYPEFPLPVAGKSSKKEIKENLEKLNYLFSHLFTQKSMFKGFSICRICGKHNGSEEYAVRVGKNEFIFIPEGYLHYIEEHSVKMDETINKVYEFYKSGMVKQKFKEEKWKR